MPMQKSVHSSTVYNGQKVEITANSSNEEWTDKMRYTISWNINQQQKATQGNLDNST